MSRSWNVSDESTAAPVETPSRRRRVAPFIALAVAVLLAGLFVVLAGAERPPTRPPRRPCSTARRPKRWVSWPTARRSIWPAARGTGSCSTSSSRAASRASRSTPTSCASSRSNGRSDRTAPSSTPSCTTTSVRAVEEFFAKEGGDWPVVYDEDGSIAVGFGVAKVPETWIIDPNGIVRGRVISRVTADFLGSQLQLLQEQLS